MVARTLFSHSKLKNISFSQNSQKTLKASLSFTSTMAEPSRRKIPTRRRTASRAPQPSTTPRTASIEGWISDEDRRSEFITLWKDKPLITLKFIQSQWFVNRHFIIPVFLAEQGVKFFTEMQGTYYLDLV